MKLHLCGGLLGLIAIRSPVSASNKMPPHYGSILFLVRSLVWNSTYSILSPGNYSDPTDLDTCTCISHCDCVPSPKY